MKKLPPLFLERLESIVPSEQFTNIQKSFVYSSSRSVRVNTLKISKESAIQELSCQGIQVQPVSWMPEALIIEGVDSKVLGEIDLIKDGRLYRQHLSSMLPVHILDPQPGEHILDMCAAPGSKTTQIAARMKNQGSITAIEVVKPRYYKLKSVIEQLGAENISLKLLDARRFRSEQGFDKILVDAPCSSEGRFKVDKPKTYAYWSLRKIREMMRKQRGLLLKASRMLNSGGTLVYSTCTFAPEENEGVVSWLLRKTEGEMQVQSIQLKDIFSYPAVTQWRDKVFNDQVKKCFRVLPNEIMEGFFVVKFIKGCKGLVG